MRLIKLFFIALIVLQISNLNAQTYDADAQAFLTAANITDATQKNAINQLVLDLKAANLWTKMKAIYPFVGGTSTAHKWNLKDPRDLDAAFRLTFPNDATHNANGVDWNGSTQYANTFFIPNSELTVNNAHLSYYSRENTAIDGVDIGADNNFLSQRWVIAARWGDNNGYYNSYGVYEDKIMVSSAIGSGFFVSSRTSSNNFSAYRNGSSIGSLTSSSTGTLPVSPLYIGAMNAAGSPINFSNRQCSFASIGDGLTANEVSSFNTAVDAYLNNLMSTGGGTTTSTSQWTTSENNIYNNNTGNIGIGTTSPTEKLSVNGNIKTRKIIVTQTGWADYVFHSSYKLRSLSSLEKFIKQNKHLPDVPSAKAVKKEGLDISATQAALLRKIEELTLYVIEQDKKNQEQQKEINVLKSKLLMQK